MYFLLETNVNGLWCCDLDLMLYNFIIDFRGIIKL